MTDFLPSQSDFSDRLLELYKLMSLKPPLPKEHGSWAMLIVPLLLGLIIAPA
ncbi:MAG: YwiC-like family protein, partial [Planctomycetota bacterium]